MTKYLSTLLILIFTGFIPISCCLFSTCPCGGFDEVKDFNINELELSTIDGTGIEIDTSNFYSYLDLSKLITISEKQYTAYRLDNTNHALISSAKACSPPVAKALQSFKEIIIIAGNSFTLISDEDVINESEDITDRFEMAERWSSSFSPIASFISSDRTIWDYYEYKIKLQARPHTETNMKLIVTILMTDGSSYTFNNEIMKVK